MSTEKNLKDFSAKQIEAALAKGLTELLGREYSVLIEKVDFAGPAALLGRVPLEITVAPAPDCSTPF